MTLLNFFTAYESVQMLAVVALGIWGSAALIGHHTRKVMQQKHVAKTAEHKQWVERHNIEHPKQLIDHNAEDA